MIYEILRWPSVAWFILAMSLELIIVTKMYTYFGEQEAKHINNPRLKQDKKLAIFAMGCFVFMNGYAGYEVADNPDLGKALITKLGFSISGAVFMLWVLRQKVWERNDGPNS